MPHVRSHPRLLAGAGALALALASVVVPAGAPAGAATTGTGVASPVITAAPASPGSSRTPVWSFTTTSGTSTRCTLTYGGVAVAGPATCAGSQGYDLAGQRDGTYTFSVSATDPATGATSSPASNAYTLQTVPPAPTITAQPASPAANRSPSWSFTIAPGATATCALRSGTATVSGPSTCSSPASYDLAGQSDGTYTFSVTATSPGGTGPAATNGYTLDTTPPATPVITVAPSSPGSTPTPSWSFTSPAATTPICRLSGPSGYVVAGTCSSPATFDLSGHPNGTYTFTITATDAAGNTSAPATNAYDFDTVAPGQPTITSTPGSTGNARRVAWGFAAPAGTSARCALSRGGTSVAPPAVCSSPASYDLTGQPDGTYTFAVAAVDAAGNVSTPTTSAYALDTSPPAAPVLTAFPSSPGRAAVVTWSFTTSTGTSTSCALTLGGAAVAGPGSCSGSATYDLTGRADGDYTFAAVAIDAAGNASAPAGTTYRLDLAPPPAPTITGAPPSPGSSGAPTWSFTAEAGSATTCSLARNGTIVGGPVTCAASQRFDLAGQPDGSYTFSVVAADGAGNAGPAATSTYSYDTTPPAAAVITSAPGSPGASRHPAWSFTTGTSETATCSLSSGSRTVVAAAPCTSPATFDLSGSSDGTYTLAVVASDAAGNLGPASSSDYRLDTAGPAVPVITSAPSSPTNARAPSWTFVAEPGATTTCALLDASGAVLVAPVPCTGTQTESLTDRPDGSYALSVVATDAAGNPSPAATSSVVLDTAAPAAPALTSSPTSPSNGRQPSWSFTTDQGTTTSCSVLRGATIVVAPTPCGGTYTVDLSGQPDGVYTLTATSKDAAGNIGAPAAGSYQLDTTPPPAPSVTTTPASPSQTTHLAWGFTAEPTVTTTCALWRGSTLVASPSTCAGTTSYDLAGQPDGLYTLAVTATDRAGNTSRAATSSYTLDRTAPAAPTITKAPASPGSALKPSWTFSSDAGTTTSCAILLADGTVALGPLACTSPMTFDLSGQPDGTYTFTVGATDAAGNVGPKASRSYVLSTARPPPPTVTGGPPATGHAAVVSFGFSAASGTVATCSIGRESVVVATAPCSGSAIFDLGPQPDGTYTFAVVAADSFGNVSAPGTRTYLLDRVPPPAPQITAAPPAAGTAANPTWAFTSEAGTTAICTLAHEGSVVQGPAPCAGSAAFDLTRLPAGGYVFSVVATDAAGNTSAAASGAYTYQAPVAPAAAPTTPAAPAVPGPVTLPIAPPAGPAPPPLVLTPPTTAAPEPTAPRVPEALPAKPQPDAGIASVVHEVKKVATAISKKAAFPIALLLLVLGFLALQDRIDRRDPKLAKAPVHATTDLGFAPPPSRQEGSAT